MPVFISYRHSDRATALYVNERLKTKGINTYLDVLDSESQSTDDITSVITKRVESCTHLIAVVSQDTAKSWWVPFEVGEATIISRRIASYKTGHLELPAYLQKWPILSNDRDIDFFADAYKKDVGRSLITESMESILGSITNRRSSADEFHKQLKQRIFLRY